MTFQQLAFNNVTRNRRTYAAYFLSSSFSVMAFFVYAMFMFHSEIQQGVYRELVIKGMRLAEYIIYVFSFFFILYSVSAFLKSRKKEFGILMMHGMSKGQLNRLVFLENMIIGIASIVTGIFSGLIFSKLILLAGANILDMEHLPFYLPWKALLLTLAAFAGLFLFISLCTAFLVRGNKLIELLQGSAKPKKEPKASILLSLLAAGLLLSGYYLSFTATDGTVAPRMLPVTALVIVGTYFLFTQLSVFTIGILKQNRVFYWHKTNLITLSDLAYRMKDNARMFFLVAIVSAVAFSAVGTLASTATLEEQVRDEHPFAFNLAADSEGPQITEVVSRIEDALKKEKLPHEKLQTEVLFQTSEQSGKSVALVQLSDYNRFAKALGYQTESIQGMEARFIPGATFQIKQLRERKLDVTLKESGIALQINGSVNRSIFAQGAMGINVLLVSDQVYQAVKTPISQRTYIGYKVENWQATEKLGQSMSESREWKGFFITSYAFQLKMEKQLNGIMLFIGVLVGAVFFVAAGSFLYFRLYTDLDYDKRQYLAITKVGLAEQELNKIVTSQLVILFFVPVAVAVIHSVFAFVALQSLLYYSIATTAFIVLGCFLLFQILYFLLIRARYLRHVKEAVL